MALHADLNCISLCTGGGGLDLGVELAIPTARVVCMVEREAFAVARLVEAMREDLMADAPVWSDARTFRGRPWRGLVDGVFGGIPCQPHSLAGKRLGEDDERDLWSVARRIIVQSGAWWCLIENVGGMLSSGGAERVWRDLHRLGFAVEGGLFRASEVGTSHERERLFVLAVADARDDGQQRRAQPNLRQVEPQKQASRRSDVERCDRPVVDTLGGGRDRRAIEPQWGSQGRAADEWTGVGPLFPPGPRDVDGWRDLLGERPQVEPAVRGDADGLAARVDQLRLLGNGVVPLQAAYALRSLATDLARRSAGAAQLVRLMGEA